MDFLNEDFRATLTRLVEEAELEADIQGLSGAEAAVYVIEYLKGFTQQ
ncbi:hypothetical protein RJD39_04805 [Vibrio scophthalmi]